MAHLTGESESSPPRLNFDRRLKLEFHGFDTTSDSDLLGLARTGRCPWTGQQLADTRTGRNGRHVLIEMAIRVRTHRAATKQAASNSQMGGFEMEWLANDENLVALDRLIYVWFCKATTIHLRERGQPKVPPNSVRKLLYSC